MTTAGMPAWVRKRDGRLVPFEADRISRSLFAAAEECGRPDAFLARELADVVVHFLADETEGRTPSTVEVAEVVVKVLRELRHHDLAAAFEEHGRRRRHGGSTGLYDRPRAVDESPAEAVEQCLRRYSLQTVFTRDLAAAHQDGLIALGGLEAPAELASCLAVPDADEEALGGLAGACARVVVVEGPEHLLARLRPRRGAASAAWAERTAARYLRELALLERLTGRRVVLNVNSAQAPPWADAVADGPLFAALRQPADAAPLAPLCDALLALALQPEAPRGLRVDWHLGERDFAEGSRERLLLAARAALAGAPVVFAFDRPRRPAGLGEGVDRRHPAVLLAVGLNLPRLASLVREEGAPDRLLDRLGSQARLALSAGLQKRDFLRRRLRDQPSLARGFLLERARLLVTPLGLDAAVEAVLGQNTTAGGAGLELGRAIVRRLLEVLRNEGRASALEVCVDSPGVELAADAGPAGPTCWAPGAPVKDQLQTAGELHAAAEGGTATIFVPPDLLGSAEQVAGWLRWAWERTEAMRLRLVCPQPAQRQLAFAGEPGA